MRICYVGGSDFAGFTKIYNEAVVRAFVIDAGSRSFHQI